MRHSSETKIKSSFWVNSVKAWAAGLRSLGLKLQMRENPLKQRKYVLKAVIKTWRGVYTCNPSTPEAENFQL
jgi:hypothetical protein